MGRRIVISEYERLEIKNAHSFLRILNESTNENIIQNFIVASYDPDPKKHIKNLLRYIPQYKNDESKLISSISGDIIEQSSPQEGGPPIGGKWMAIPALASAILFIRGRLKIMGEKKRDEQIRIASEKAIIEQNRLNAEKEKLRQQEEELKQ